MFFLPKMPQSLPPQPIIVCEDLAGSYRPDHFEYMNLKMNSPLKADHYDLEQIRRTVAAELEGIGSILEYDKRGEDN